MAKSLDKMIVKELRAYARARGIRTGGKKADLLARIKSFESPVQEGKTYVVSRTRRPRRARLYSTFPGDTKRYGRQRAPMRNYGTSTLIASYERQRRDAWRRGMLARGLGHTSDTKDKAREARADPVPGTASGPATPTAIEPDPALRDAVTREVAEDVARERAASTGGVGSWITSVFQPWLPGPTFPI